MPFINLDGFLFRYGINGVFIFAVDTWIRIAIAVVIIYFLLIRTITRKPDRSSTVIRVTVIAAILLYLFYSELNSCYNYIVYMLF